MEWIELKSPDLIGALEDVGLGLGAPGAGPPDQLLPRDSHRPLSILSNTGGANIRIRVRVCRCGVGIFLGVLSRTEVGFRGGHEGKRERLWRGFYRSEILERIRKRIENRSFKNSSHAREREMVLESWIGKKVKERGRVF